MEIAHVRVPGTFRVQSCLIRHPTKTFTRVNHQQINFNIMKATRRSGRAAKSKKHFDSSPYSKPRNASPKSSNRTLLKPQIALQPVIAENFLTPHTSITPQQFSEFVKLPIQKQDAVVLLAEGPLEPFEIFSLFFPPEFLHTMITATVCNQ
jgi:hypothetical protein